MYSCNTQQGVREGGDRVNVPRPPANMYHLLVILLQNLDEASCCIFDSFLPFAIAGPSASYCFNSATQQFSRIFPVENRVLGSWSSSAKICSETHHCDDAQQVDNNSPKNA